MNNNNFILTIIKAIERKFGVISWGYEDSNLDKSVCWWFICINDYEVYTSNEDFKKMTNAYFTIGKKRGIKIIFSFCKENENKLYKMSEENNLIMNI